MPLTMEFGIVLPSFYYRAKNTPEYKETVRNKGKLEPKG